MQLNWIDEKTSSSVVGPKSAKRHTTKLVAFMELNIKGIEGKDIGYKLKLI